jgi:hypothetical protein
MVCLLTKADGGTLDKLDGDSHEHTPCLHRFEQRPA